MFDQNKLTNILIKLYCLTPLFIQEKSLKLIKIMFPIRFSMLEKRIMVINYFKLNHANDGEMLSILNFIKKNIYIFFPYDFTRKYNAKEIQVYTDRESKMNYVLHNNKRLYFPVKRTQQEIRDIYIELLAEQDPESPHLYETSTFHVEDGDVILDVGAAEGIFTLNNIEKIKKSYLFEYEDEWIEPLKETFKPWSEKITIVKKYVTDVSDNDSIKLDDFQVDKVNFIKADIEGAETQLLTGAKKLLQNQDGLKIAICTYHNQNDGEKINKTLNDLGFECEFSNAYMIYIYNEQFNPPYLRKGLIRAKKINIKNTHCNL
ncbi:MAG: FkbM family methyltransferase [Methanobrevibacter sp. CfCl-M3]